MFLLDQLRIEDRRLRYVALGILGAMGLLLAGLWYVQIVSAKRYQARLNSQSLRTVRLPAIRGKVLDRNGNPLAESRPRFNVQLFLDELRPYFDQRYTDMKREFLQSSPRNRWKREMVGRYRRLARFDVVSNLVWRASASVDEPVTLRYDSFASFYGNERSLPMPVLADLDERQVAQFFEQSAHLPGMELEIQPLRIYPHRTVAAHVLGHLKLSNTPREPEDYSFKYRLDDFEGQMGIESLFEEELRGVGGRKLILVDYDAFREEEEVFPEPVPGKNVTLTLDLAVQTESERALHTVAPDVKGAVVVLDVRNGDILAMASAPAFDPNLFIPRMRSEDWARIIDPERQALFNRATKGAYAPGSVFKIVVGLACLEEGLDPSEKYYSAGYFRISPRGRPWNDLAPPGLYDFRTAFLRSSNAYFQEHGLEVGPEKIVEVGRRFGLGEETGLPEGFESAGYFPTLIEPEGRGRGPRLKKRSGDAWYPGDTANLCIGQGEISVTPLQMAVLTAAIANGGTIWVPRLVMRVDPQDPLADEGAEWFPPKVRDQVAIQPRHLKILHEAMLADVEDPKGTGRAARLAGFQIGGKTGTAQRPRRREDGSTSMEYVTWFVSFAPVDSPRYAVVVMVVDGESGGANCAPVARKVYQALLRREESLLQERLELVGLE